MHRRTKCAAGKSKSSAGRRLIIWSTDSKQTAETGINAVRCDATTLTETTNNEKYIQTKQRNKAKRDQVRPRPQDAERRRPATSAAAATTETKKSRTVVSAVIFSSRVRRHRTQHTSAWLIARDSHGGRKFDVSVMRFRRSPQLDEARCDAMLKRSIVQSMAALDGERGNLSKKRSVSAGAIILAELISRVCSVFSSIRTSSIAESSRFSDKAHYLADVALDNR